MTHDELMSLPESGGWDMVERDGKVVPVQRPTLALYAGQDEPFVVADAEGTLWMVGWAGGARYRSRFGWSVGDSDLYGNPKSSRIVNVEYTLRGKGQPPRVDT